MKKELHSKIICFRISDTLLKQLEEYQERIGVSKISKAIRVVLEAGLEKLNS